jgi:hypothetical protein
MDPEAPQEPQEEEQPAEPQQPQYPQQPDVDIEAAYDAIARHEGWDPRLARFQVQELKERREALERREREIEALQRKLETQRPPTPDFGDPTAQLLYENKQEIAEMKRMFSEEREERRKEAEEQRLVDRLARELDSSFITIARQNGMSKEQLDAYSKNFYPTLLEIYPEPEMIQKIGPDVAVRNTFRLMGSQRQQRPNVNGRGPTATRTIPGSPQPYIPGGGILPPEESLSADQLEGETDEQYRARLERIISAANVKRLPDGYKVSSR